MKTSDCKCNGKCDTICITVASDFIDTKYLMEKLPAEVCDAVAACFARCNREKGHRGPHEDRSTFMKNKSDARWSKRRVVQVTPHEILNQVWPVEETFCYDRETGEISRW